MAKDLASRLFFKAKVNEATGCWEWTAAKTYNGYGTLKIGGRAGKVMRAHRVAYEVHRGPISEGMYVCHSCDNRACVNPEHLFLGTHSDNMADRDGKGRQARLRGEAHHNSKLTDDDVRGIREARGFTQQELAKKYGVHQTLISLVRRGESWAHVDLGK